MEENYKDENGALESIAETDNEDQGDEEASDGVTCPITDDTATEDDTVDHTNGSDEDGKYYYYYR